MNLGGFLLLCIESVVGLLWKGEESEGSWRKATATILSTVLCPKSSPIGGSARRSTGRIFEACTWGHEWCVTRTTNPRRFNATKINHGLAGMHDPGTCFE